MTSISPLPAASQHPADGASAVAAGVGLSVVGVATFLILPQFIAGAVESMGLSERDAAILSSMTMAGTTVSAVLAGAWIRRADWRRAALLALLGLIGCNGASLVFHALAPFLALQFGAGFCGGSLYSLALTALSDGRRADRNFGLSVAAQVLFQVGGLLAGPALIEAAGIDALLAGFAVLATGGLALVRFLPLSGRAPPVATSDAALLAPRLAFAFAGCFLFLFNVGCYWTFIDLIGASAGLSARQLSVGLAVGVACGVPGALLSTWLGEKFGRLAPIAIGAALSAAAIGLLREPIQAGAFVASAMLYNFGWNYSLTYQYATVNAVDGSGRAVALAPAFHAAGGAAGPALAALLVTTRGHESVLALASGAVLLSLGCFAVSTRLRPADAATDQRIPIER